MYLKIHPENPSIKRIRTVVEVLRNGGIIIYPTDSVYAIGCDLMNQRAAERIARIKGLKPQKANFSVIFDDLSHLSDYTFPISNNVFKLIRKNLPGPFTFILQTNNKVPKIFKTNKKTIGIRIPDNNIAREIVRELGNPLLTTSVLDDDSLLEYTTDPEAIFERYKQTVDIVIDGGFGNNVASTVVDCTSEEVEIIRQGIGELVLG